MKLFEKGRLTSSRTRHIHIRYFFIKDRVESGEVCISYMPTEDMVADLLTKGSFFGNFVLGCLTLLHEHRGVGSADSVFCFFLLHVYFF